MSKDLASNDPPDKIDELIQILELSSKGSPCKAASCTDPKAHSEVCKNLIDYTDLKPGKHHALEAYRELYKVLSGISKKASPEVSSTVEKMIGKYELRERELFLEKKKTVCKHLCLYNRMKDFFVPSKAEIRNIFLFAYKPECTWEEVKEKLTEMRLYSKASGVKYETLFEKRQEEKSVLNGKRKKVKDLTVKDSTKKFKDKETDNDILECEECYVINSDSMSDKMSTEKKFIFDGVNFIKAEFNKQTKMDTSYPIKCVLSDAMDQSWIGPFLHLISSLPEIAANMLRTGTDEYNRELKQFINDYWKKEKKFLAEPIELFDYVKKIERNETNYQDFWQTWIAYSSRYEVSATEKTLYEPFIGKFAERKEPFLYSLIKLNESFDFAAELDSYFLNKKLSKLPFFFSAILNKTNPQAEISLPFALDLSKYSQSESMYKLCHVICCCLHESTPRYFSYILNPVNGRWYMASENEIKEATKLDFSHACFVIYRQRDPDIKLIDELIAQ